MAANSDRDPTHRPQGGGRRPRLRERHPHIPAHRRYSRFVSLMKVVLPATAVVLLALIVVWPKLGSVDDGFHIGFAKISPDEVENLSMVNARYFGVDSSNRPFTVTADVATEEDPDSGIIVLQSPKADFSTRSGANVYMEAERGFYHEKEQVLDLEGKVALFHDSGYEIHTERARIDLENSTAKGDAPVTGNGPQGRMEGEGFEIHQGGKQVVVTGRSSMQLMGAKGK